MTPAMPSSDLQDAAANARLVPPPGAVPQRLGDVRVPVPLVELFTIAAEYERAGKLQEADRLFNHILAVAPRSRLPPIGVPMTGGSQAGCCGLSDEQGGEQVIPPFLTGFGRRLHAAIFSFWSGVMPPMPMFGRSSL